MHRSPRPALLMTAALALTGVSACSGDVLDVTVGDCLDRSDLQGEQVSSVSTVDCAEPHDVEVYSQVELPEGSYPGEDRVRALTEEHCTTAFEDFVGVPYEDSELYFSYLTPTQESWSDAEDRTGLCLLLADEPVTGSLEGAGI